MTAAPPPMPRSPPKYPDFCGRRRLHQEVQVLNREIGFLEEELQSLDGLQPASRCCKEVNEFVGANPDPLIPIKKKRHNSCRIWKWLRSKLCCISSSICFSSGCSLGLGRPSCCGCCKLPTCQCCCDRQCGCSRCCSGCDVSCCWPSWCRSEASCRGPQCCHREDTCCKAPKCWEDTCCKAPKCCCPEVSCCRPRCCCLPSLSCPRYSCGCIWSCPRCTNVQLCPTCTKTSCISGCEC